MMNETQVGRYKRLLRYLDEHFKEEINIQKVEAISHYSYRNINRIFESLHSETIGKYVKRIRLEKAAEYLKYSNSSISDIAFKVGFSDVAAFSKAFKNNFNCPPSAFRNSTNLMKHAPVGTSSDHEAERKKLQFETETLPAFQVLFLEYRGKYENIKAVEETWNLLFNYATENHLLAGDPIFLGEVIDDNEISDAINCRYNTGMILETTLPFTPEGLFKIKTHRPQKYATFIHQGTHESSADMYHKIYSHWMTDVDLEMADLPVLEFFLNDEADTPAEELLTEIYIPVQ